MLSSSWGHGSFQQKDLAAADSMASGGRLRVLGTVLAMSWSISGIPTILTSVSIN